MGSGLHSFHTSSLWDTTKRDKKTTELNFILFCLFGYIPKKKIHVTIY